MQLGLYTYIKTKLLNTYQPFLNTYQPFTFVRLPLSLRLTC